MPKILAFTGTRQGMTIPQMSEVAGYLVLHPEFDEYHHGGCVGADARFHQMVIELMEEYELHIHWSDIPGLHMSHPRNAVQHEAKRPLLRNRDMADIANTLLATPKEADEITRSGTWATIRYARKAGAEVIIFAP